jgi:ureidoglycolate dehydrogenase (NAD+)
LTTMTSASSSRTVAPEKLKAFCVEALLKVGMREADAFTVATVLVTTDTWGIFTHGARHLRNYLRKIRAGGIDPQAAPEVVSEGPAWATIDGHAAIGMVPSCLAMELAIRKAQTFGLAYVGVRKSSHFGAAGYYANMAVPHDMIGLVMSNADPNMTAPGARVSVIGNNPLAFAVPAGQEKPVFLDIAMSTVAASKILAAKGLGVPIPENWIVDENGIPTISTSGYPLTGSLQPMAGHKGYGLAILIEVLSAVLTGAAVTTEVGRWISDLSRPPGTGHAFIAIDIGTIMPAMEFKARVDRMIRDIHAAPLAQGAERIYLPGEMEWEKRERAMQHGMTLPADVMADMIGIGEDVGLDAMGLLE